MNKKILIIISIIFISLIYFTSNSTRSKYIDDTTALKIYGTEDLLSTGKISSPWRDINIITRLAFRNIFTMDSATNQIKPDLAESYTISDDGLIYKITFREDLIWSDNEPITIDDVIFSIEAAILDKEHTRLFPIVFNSIVGVSQFIEGKENMISGLFVNDNVLTIALKKPIANFINILSQFTILPKHILKSEDIPHLSENDFWLDPVVSGMYKLGEYIPNEQVTYIYNDKYVGEVPFIQSLLIRDDYSTEEVDYYTTNDISEMINFQAIPYMEEINIDSVFYRYIVYNIEKVGELDPILNDYRVRSAIAHAIDIESIINDVYYNTVEPFNHGSVIIGSDAIKEHYHEYNTEKSKQLLLDANYNFERPIIIMYYYKDETSAKFMQELAEDLQEVGFKTQIIQSSELYTNDPEKDIYDIALKGLSAFDIVEWFAEYDSSHDLHRYVFGGEPIFDDLIDELNRTTTMEDRKEVFKKIQLLGTEVLYKFPLFTMNYKAYINTNRLSIPEDVVLGNPKYKYDNNFESWQIIK